MTYYVLEKDLELKPERLNLLQEIHDTLSNKKAKERAKNILHKLYALQKQLDSHGFIEVTKEDVLLLSSEDPLYTYVFSIKKGADILSEEEMAEKFFQQH